MIFAQRKRPTFLMAVHQIRCRVFEVQIGWFITYMFSGDLLAFEMWRLLDILVIVNGLVGSKTRMMANNGFFEWRNRLLMVEAVCVVKQNLWIQIDKFLNVSVLALIVANDVLSVLKYYSNVVVKNIPKTFIFLEVLELGNKNRWFGYFSIHHRLLLRFNGEGAHKW